MWIINLWSLFWLVQVCASSFILKYLFLKNKMIGKPRNLNCLYILNVFINFLKFPCRIIHGESLHENIILQQPNRYKVYILCLSWIRMNISGRTSRHVNTLVHSYDFCVRKSDKILFISVSTSPFFLYCYLVPRMTHWLSVYYC